MTSDARKRLAERHHAHVTRTGTRLAWHVVCRCGLDDEFHFWTTAIWVASSPEHHRPVQP